MLWTVFKIAHRGMDVANGGRLWRKRHTRSARGFAYGAAAAARHSTHTFESGRTARLHEDRKVQLHHS